MKYFVLNKYEDDENEAVEINNENIVKNLNMKQLVVGQKVTVFGAIPHYLKVKAIDTDKIILQRTF